MALGDTGQVVVIHGVSYIVLGSAGGTLAYAVKQGELLPAVTYVVDLSQVDV